MLCRQRGLIEDQTQGVWILSGPKQWLGMASIPGSRAWSKQLAAEVWEGQANPGFCGKDAYIVRRVQDFQTGSQLLIWGISGGQGQV